MTGPSSRVIRFVLLAGFLAFGGCDGIQDAPLNDASDASSPANASYRLDNGWVTLVDGLAEAPAAPGSSAKIRTRIWGEPTVADLNGDGLDDAVVILTQETGGSGTFFYVAAAVASPRGFSGRAGLFVGDRIAPNTVAVRDGKVTVSYMTRGQGQSFAEKPTVEQVLDLLLSADARTFVLARDREGETKSILPASAPRFR